MIKKCFKSFLIILTAISSTLAVSLTQIPDTQAANLATMTAALSNNKASASGTTYTINTNTASTSDIKSIKISFSTLSGGTNKPANLSLASVAMGTLSNLGTDWQIDTTYFSSGVISLIKNETISLQADQSISIELTNITNSALNDCESSNDTLSDTCYINLSTYSDNGNTKIDSGTTTYTIFEDPVAEFKVEGVPADSTHNGITTTKDSESTNINFGNLSADNPVYLTQKITVRTNAPHGYKVYLVFEHKLFGTANNNTEINFFGGTDATWDTPQYWEKPYGTTPNDNTGWIGVNTSDGSILNWGGASNKFAPPSSTVRSLVAQSTSPQLTSKEIYLSYALETNQLQAGDLYRTNVSYQFEPIY